MSTLHVTTTAKALTPTLSLPRELQLPASLVYQVRPLQDLLLDLVWEELVSRMKMMILIIIDGCLSWSRWNDAHGGWQMWSTSMSECQRKMCQLDSCGKKYVPVPKKSRLIPNGGKIPRFYFFGNLILFSFLHKM